MPPVWDQTTAQDRLARQNKNITEIELRWVDTRGQRAMAAQRPVTVQYPIERKTADVANLDAAITKTESDHAAMLVLRAAGVGTGVFPAPAPLLARAATAVASRLAGQRVDPALVDDADWSPRAG